MRRWLFIVPLVVFWALWNVNWKREHPTPTSVDITERALLRRASSIHIELLGNSTWIKRNQWSDFLKNFYLIPTHLSPQSTTRWVWFSAQFTNINAQPVGYRVIRFDPCSRRATYNTALSDGSWTTFELHPTSTRALEQLLAQHPQEARMIEWWHNLHPCP
jgi:hypothetical protein